MHRSLAAACIAIGTLAVADARAACESDDECKGDRVCENGRCVAPTPPPRRSAPDRERSVTATEESAPVDRTEETPKMYRRGFVFVPRVGFVLAGSGDLEREGTYSGDSTGFNDDTDSNSFDDKSGLVLGVDGLISTGKVRFGLGALFTPSTKGEVEGTSYKVGSDLMLSGVIEPLIPISPTVALAFRVQGGGMLMFPGGDVTEDIDAKKDDCTSDLTSGDPKCDVNSGPGLGWSVGGGLGIVTGGDKVRFRADLLFLHYSTGVWSYEHTHRASPPRGEYTHSVSYGATGNRFLLLTGLEL
jgi:hypothetical protein